MLLSKTIKVKVASPNMKYYKSLGYEIPFHYDNQHRKVSKGEIIEVKVEDLSPKSEELVEVECDYCGEKYLILWRNYLEAMGSPIKKIACKKCKIEKIKESNISQYGVENVSSIPEIHKIQEDANRKNQNKVIDKFKEMGFIPHFKKEDYKNGHQKLPCHCENHPSIEQYKTFDGLMDGDGCSYCYYEMSIGENSPNWKGGITETNVYLRGLLNEWKRKSFEKYNYKCCISGIGGFLVIHHGYSFKDIVTEVFVKLNLKIKPRICDYTKEELVNIEKLFLEIHMDNLGYPITIDLHHEFHSIYGTIGCTKENFIEYMNEKNKELKVAQ